MESFLSKKRKKIIKEIEELEKSLPLTIPLAAIEKEIDRLQKEKKDSNEEMN